MGRVKEKGDFYPRLFRAERVRDAAPEMLTALKRIRACIVYDNPQQPPPSEFTYHLEGYVESAVIAIDEAIRKAEKGAL